MCNDILQWISWTDSYRNTSTQSGIDRCLKLDSVWLRLSQHSCPEQAALLALTTGKCCCLRGVIFTEINKMKPSWIKYLLSARARGPYPDVFLRCIIGCSGYETEADTRRGESHFACWSFDSDSVTRVCFDYISRHKWYIMCSIQSADLHSLPFLSSHLSLSSSCSCLDSRSVFCWQSPFWAPIEIMLMVDWLPPAPVFSSCPLLSLSHSLLMDPRGKSGPR